jgi:hypothetical protein
VLDKVTAVAYILGKNERISSVPANSGIENVELPLPEVGADRKSVV